MQVSDTIQLVQVVGGGIGALAIQAIGLILYLNSAFTTLKTNFERELAAQNKAHGEAIEMLHGRINNVRKEFVPEALYQRDLAEVKQSQREILVAINHLGTAMQSKLTDLEKTNAVQEYRLGSIDDTINGRNVGRGSQGA